MLFFKLFHGVFYITVLPLISMMISISMPQPQSALCQGFSIGRQVEYAQRRDYTQTSYMEMVQKTVSTISCFFHSAPYVTEFSFKSFTFSFNIYKSHNNLYVVYNVSKALQGKQLLYFKGYLDRLIDG